VTPPLTAVAKVREVYLFATLLDIQAVSVVSLMTGAPEMLFSVSRPEALDLCQNVDFGASGLLSSKYFFSQPFCIRSLLSI
jgi:hypothetical protein